MNIREALEVLGGPLKFGDSTQIDAVHILEHLEELREKARRCNSLGHMPCEECEGAGVAECSACDGSGQVPCKACDGGKAACKCLTPDERELADAEW